MIESFLPNMEVTSQFETKSNAETMGSAPPLRVCHIASGDAWGGAEVQLATLLKALSSRSDVRLQVILLNEGRLAEEIRQLGIDLVVIPQKVNNLAVIASKASRFLHGQMVDVLHAHRDKEYIVALLIRGMATRPLLVRTQHGRPERHVGWTGVKAAVLHAVDRKLARWSATKVVSVSRELTSYMQTYLPDNQIAVVPNGIDISGVRSNLTSSVAKQQLGLSPDVPVIGTVGRLFEVKRIDRFLSIARHISRTLQANFIVVGEGPERQRLEKMADDLGLSGAVKFLGSRRDIPDVLRAMDIMAVVSDREGMPMAVLEAMHMGVPVVSRAVGGIPEVIDTDLTGVLVDGDDARTFADACIRLLHDYELRSAIAKRSPKVVAQRFSSENNAEELVRLYRSILE